MLQRDLPTDSRAVAWDPASGRLAAGDDRAVWLAEPGAVARRILRRGPVHDLEFGPDGRLWMATEGGLFVRDGDGRVREASPGPGSRARAVLRVSIAEGHRFCAGAGGLFHAAGSGPWQRLVGPRSAQDFTALVWDARRRVLLALIAGDLQRFEEVEDAGGVHLRADVPTRVNGGASAAVDLALLADGTRVVLFERSLGVRAPEPSVGSGAAVWRIHRPALPPGALGRRLVGAAGELWMATSRGLLRASSAAGPWQPTGEEAGNAGIADLAPSAAGLVAAGERGVLIGLPSLPGPHGAPPPAEPVADPPQPGPLPIGPPVTAVQRATLRYLDLGVERVRRLQRGVARRGWLPTLELRGAYGGGRGRGDDYDETFTSGERRLFHDRESDHARDFDVVAVLRWDLGDVVYHPEQIDVSREGRELIELRDEVLDEVNQLYFERRRVLLDLHIAPPGDPAARARLRLRARELAAGLNAWTGGWWSQQADAGHGPVAASSSPRSDQENLP